MVGEGRMSSVLGVPARHVAADTVAIRTWMRRLEISHVASEALGSVELNRLQRLIVRIVAGPAPELSVALTGAHTPSELLYVADDFEFAGVRTRSRNVDVGCENIFQRPPRPKVAKLLPWIEYPAYSQQMALFADAIPRRRRELRGIDDRPSARIAEMFFGRSMAPLASDAFRGEHRGAIPIRCTGDMQGSSRVAKKASFRDGPREIWIGQSLVSRRQIVSLPALVVSHRRLK